MKAKIKKYLEGKASEKEIYSILDWIEQGENQHKFKEIKSEWKADTEMQDIGLFTLLEMDKFKSRILNENVGKIKTLNLLQNLYKYAAILLLVISLGGIFIYNSGQTKRANLFYNTIIAENGQLSKALLPDSTVIWLNSGSNLKYNNQFGITNRKVELNGQAYFDVTKNKKLPFVVTCDKINVRVLGTEFTAESYPNSKEINVLLVEGSVELTPKTTRKAFATLRPNEMMVYDKHDNGFRISEVVVEKYISWREGIIHIYDQPLKDVATKLQKRYNQKIVVAPELENYRVTFSIRNEDFNDVIEILKAITSAKAIQKGDIIYIDKS